MLAVEAIAQDTGGAIEEIIVQARKRSESIQEVPVAVSAVAGDQIEQLDIQSAIGLSARVPNFQAPRNTVSFGAPQFYMRGAGRANNNWNAENAVAVFIDDVYMQSTAGAFIDMIDFESVEVLRGPQGTLYGRNATTGALKFNPRRPDLAKSRIKADVTTGSNGRLDTRLSLGAPLRVDELAFKLDLYRTENDGYLTLVDAANNALDDEFGYMEHYGGRASLLWKPQDALELELNLDVAKQDDGTNLITPIAPANPADFTQLLSKRGTVSYEPVYGPSRAAGEPLLGDGGSEFDGWGAVFKLSWQTDLGTFRSITGWREYEDTFLSQLSGLSTPSTVFGVTLWSLVDSYNEFEQLTQEFQFTGQLGERLDYVVGLYYFQNDWSQLQYGATIGLPANFSPVTLPGQTIPYGGTWNDTLQDTESKAIYFDASWRLTDAISLFFCGRQTWDDKQVDYTSRLEDNVTLYPGFPVSSDESWSKFTPRAGVNWQIDDRAMVYLSYAEGFKAGNLEGDRASAPEPATTWLDPEVVETWEIGLKADWFDGRLRTNLAVFTSDYTDKADLISPQTAATADVGIDGVEVELTWQPLDDLRLWVNAGFLDAEYTGAESDHPIFNPDATGFVLGLDAEPVVTPEYSYSAGGNYTWQLGGLGSLELAANLVAVDDHYNGLGVQNWDSEIVEAYEVLGAAATFRSADESWSLAIGADNLTDEEYWTTGFFGSVPEYAGRYYADGRTWYARLTYLRF
jgi:iron complex outermembrane receptor protein